jgi:peptide/nickel transport system permease protein
MELMAIDSAQQKQASEIKKMEQPQTLWKIIFVQFLEHKMAVIGTCFIAFFIIIALTADVIAWSLDISPNTQNVSARFLMPFSYAEQSSSDKENAVDSWIRGNPESAAALQREIALKQLIDVAEIDTLYELVQKPPEESKVILKQLSDVPSSFKDLFKRFRTFHIFGTDEVGRDVFIRLIYGARVSIGVGILSTIVAALIGLLVGSLAGFYGGWIDSLLMRLTDALLSLPLIPVMIVIAAVDLQKVPFLSQFVGSGYESILKMVVILCLFSWMTVARLVRGSILSLKEREFILAARTVGCKDSTIIFRHLFPNVVGPMLVSLTLGVGSNIIFEAALSFLGLGIMPPTSSWGNMLNNALELMYKNVWLIILPGLMILITVVSFNFVGDGLQNAVDPKSIKR